jgi:hypothetical protein
MASNDVILAELQKITARLAVIEAKVGSGPASATVEGERSRLAADFEASVVNGPAKTAIDAATALGGAEGPVLVRSNLALKKRAEGIRARPPDPAFPLLQAAVLSEQFGFVLRVLDMAGASKKPAKEVRPNTRATRVPFPALFLRAHPPHTHTHTHTQRPAEHPRAGQRLEHCEQGPEGPAGPHGARRLR